MEEDKLLNGNALYDDEEESLPERLQSQSVINDTNINFTQNSFRIVQYESQEPQCYEPDFREPPRINDNNHIYFIDDFLINNKDNDIKEHQKEEPLITNEHEIECYKNENFNIDEEIPNNSNDDADDDFIPIKFYNNDHEIDNDSIELYSQFDVTEDHSIILDCSRVLTESKLDNIHYIDEDPESEIECQRVFDVHYNFERVDQLIIKI